MNKGLGLGYRKQDTPVHRLTGAAKLLMVALVSVGAMITYDTRYLLAIVIGSAMMFAAARVPVKELRAIIALIAFLMLINNVFIYLFSPEEGVRVYGSRTLLLTLAGRYTVTREQLFYQFNVTVKYFSIMPLALIFFVTTEPSEFAASLNALGAPYKAAYAVSLALRYIPDVIREFREISQAQQARGSDISKDAPLLKRVRGMAGVLFPLIVTSLDRIETVANAMELRGFGKHKRRTWYRGRPFARADYICIGVSAALAALAALLNVVNGGRFYNPF